MAIELPGLRAFQRPHAGAHQRPVGQHHLQAADPLGVLAVGGAAHPAFQGVAEHAAPAVGRDRGPEPVTFGAQVVVEVEEPHARLDQGVAGALVHLQHAVQAAQLHHHAAAHPRRRAAIAVVAALRDGPERDPGLVGQAQDRADLLHRAWPDDGRGRRLGRVIEGIGVVIVRQASGVGEDMRLAQLGPQPGERALESALGQAGRPRRPRISFVHARSPHGVLERDYNGC